MVGNLEIGNWQKTENKRTSRLAFNLLVKQNDGIKIAVAQNIKAQLEAQGIGINIIQAPEQQYYASINGRNYDIALCGMTISPSPNLNTFFGNGNLSNYANDEVNIIMQEVKNTTDKNVLKEKYQRLLEIYKTEIPYISLYNNKYTIAYSSGLVGEINPNWFYQFYGIEGWYK